MWELFAFGTFWFWALVLVEIVALIVMVHSESLGWATLSLLGFGAALQFMGGIDILGYVSTNWLGLLPILAGYVLLGIAWAILRWYWFVTGRNEQYLDEKMGFQQANNLPVDKSKPIPENLQEAWYRHLSSKNLSDLARKTLIRDHKKKWMTWASLWFLSLGIFLLQDSLAGLFRRLYNRMAATLQRIADRAFERAKIDQDFTAYDTKRAR